MAGAGRPPDTEGMNPMKTTKSPSMTPAERERALAYDKRQLHGEAIREDTARQWAAEAGLDYDTLMGNNQEAK